MTLRLAAAVLALAAPAAGAAVPPTIANEAVIEREAREIVFTAAVDPGGAETQVRLDFGTTAALGARSSLIVVPAGEEPVLVTVTLAAQPSTTYHWRFAATNEAGEATTAVQQTRTPAPAAVKKLRPPRMSFAVQTFTSGNLIGRLVGFTRPSGLPKGTKLSVRCVARCSGGRDITIGSGGQPGTLVRFSPSIPLGKRARVEVRAVRRGSIGRERTYEFRRAGDILVPVRVADRCLTASPPHRTTDCTTTA